MELARIVQAGNDCVASNLELTTDQWMSFIDNATADWFRSRGYAEWFCLGAASGFNKSRPQSLDETFFRIMMPSALAQQTTFPPIALSAKKKEGYSMSDLYYTVQCRLCPKTFEAPPMRIPEYPNEPVDQRTSTFVNKLAEHMMKRHGQEFAKIVMISQGIIGVEVLRSFEIQDEAILKRSENMRHQMFKLFQNRTLMDDELRELITKTGFTDPSGVLLNLCQGIRDYLTEREIPAQASAAVPSALTQ